jgi:uroporphyrinogen decarboxylase
MRLYNLPVKRPQPDADGFIAALLGRATPNRPPLVEYLVDDLLAQPILTQLLGRQWVDESLERETRQVYLDNVITFWLHLGYDFVRFERALPFPIHRLYAPDPAPGSDQYRAWADQHQGVIHNWEDFERYPWPTLADMDFFPYEYLNAHLPPGMGLIVSHAGGLFEHLSYLMSYEGLCLGLHDAPDLVGAIADRLGELMLDVYRHLLDLERVIALFPGDDMGFRTGTLVSPDHLRTYVLPWHKRFAALAHEKGLPYFLHSCGNLERIMEDLIVDVGIDGKHSFEDAILPVDQFQERYGDQVAVLGGLDVDILAAGSAEQVRARTRALIETCGPRGRYALGSGNSIPSYVPLENYLAMLDEALMA